MADIVDIIFDGNLEPLNKKIADGRRNVDAFVAESEAKLKGINLAGDSVSPGDNISKASDLLKTASAKAATTATNAETAANTGLAASSQAAAVAGAEQAASNTAVASSADVATASLTSEILAAKDLSGAMAAVAAANLPLIAVAGSIAIAGAGLVLYSQKNLELAEKRLETEENLAVAANRRILGVKEEVEYYRQIVDHLREAKALSNRIKSFVGQGDTQSLKAARDRTQQDIDAKAAELARLKADLKVNESSLEFAQNRNTRQNLLTELGALPEYTSSQKRADIRRSENRIEETKKQIAEVERQLSSSVKALGDYDNALTSVTENQDRVFAERFANFQKSQQQAREFEKARQEKFVQSVKEGTLQVQKLVSGYRDEFDRLFIQANSDNPFAAHILKSAKALEELEKRVRGLTPALKKQALELAVTSIATQGYSIQLNNALQTVDYKAQANKFRNPTQRELGFRYQDRLAEELRTSNSTNPDVIVRRLLDGVRKGAISQEEAIQRFNESITGLAPDAYRGFRDRVRGTFNEAQERNQQIIDEKLNLADRAKTEAQKAISDSAVVSFAGGLNPDDLTQSQRTRIAESFERMAVRNEKRQEEALSVQRDLLTTLKAINARGEALTGIVKEKGKEGLEVLIRNESDAEATARKALSPPSPEDTKRYYNLGTVSGVGGLTNQ